MNKNNPRIFYKEGWGQEGLPLSVTLIDVWMFTRDMRYLRERRD